MTDAQRTILDGLSSWAWKSPQTSREALHGLVDAGWIEHKADTTGDWYRRSEDGSEAIGVTHDSGLAGRFKL